MAIWADIGDDDEIPDPHLRFQVDTQDDFHRKQYSAPPTAQLSELDDAFPGSEVYQDACVQSVAHALRCYPIAERLAASLDLTDLSSLSMTCRSLREALVQFAPQLKQRSLRCSFEKKDESHEEYDPELIALQVAFDGHLDFSGQQLGGAAFPTLPYSQSSSALGTFNSSLGLSDKISRCARDLVGPCRKCGITVCRNCTEKPPSNKLLPNRLRRLCDACLAAPLGKHMQPLKDHQDCCLPESSSSSTRSNRSASTTSEDSDIGLETPVDGCEDTMILSLRDPCSCASKGVFLCQQCGHNVRAADDIYRRVWKWRSRYSTHLGGGLGTGLGLGNQGQKCGRGKFCLATRDAMTIMETECSDEESSSLTPAEVSRASTPILYEGDGSTPSRHKPGYLRQEIEGIGGVVKTKSKRLVKVGATVYEFRDERQSGKYLEREARGELRSWCSWCSRVSPGEQDKTEVRRHLSIRP